LSVFRCPFRFVPFPFVRPPETRIPAAARERPPGPVGSVKLQSLSSIALTLSGSGAVAVT